jgi:hypothetical protein
VILTLPVAGTEVCRNATVQACAVSAVGSNMTLCSVSAAAPALVPASAAGQYAAGNIYMDSACNATTMMAGVAVKQDACVPLAGAGFPVFGELHSL